MGNAAEELRFEYHLGTPLLIVTEEHPHIVPSYTDRYRLQE